MEDTVNACKQSRCGLTWTSSYREFTRAPQTDLHTDRVKW